MLKKSRDKTRSHQHVKRMRETVWNVESTNKAEQINCQNKKPYITKTAAKRARKKLQTTFGREFWIYRCPVCRNWHLTTKAR